MILTQIGLSTMAVQISRAQVAEHAMSNLKPPNTNGPFIGVSVSESVPDHSSDKKVYSKVGTNSQTAAAPSHQLFSLDESTSFDLSGTMAEVIAWGDYDNDGDLDLLLMGQVIDDAQPHGGSAVTRLYRNDQGSFSRVNAPLISARQGVAAWGDYDQDGDLDLLIAGEDDSGLPVTKVYRNINGQFGDINAKLTNLRRSRADWGDVDSDGDLDLLISGQDREFTARTELYRNLDGVFQRDESAALPQCQCDVAWGDFDNDSDPDILLAGRGKYTARSSILRNDEGNFVDIHAALSAVKFKGQALWGDFNVDGLVDVVLLGVTSDNRPITRLYRNDGGTFTDMNVEVPGLWSATAAWADYDNDGDPDLMLKGNLESDELRFLLSSNGDLFRGRSPAGSVSSQQISGTHMARYLTDLHVLGGLRPYTAIYRNDADGFVLEETALPTLPGGSAAWGDADGDGLLDVVISGQAGNAPQTELWINTGNDNERPQAPSRPSVTIKRSKTIFSWQSGFDTETPRHGLTYNLAIDRVTSHDGLENSAVVRTANPLLPRVGNVRFELTTTAHLVPGHYGWSVQAVDSSFAGSPWVQGGTFHVQPDVIITKDIEPTEVQAGESVTLTVHFTNVGNYVAKNVVITDILPIDLITQRVYVRPESAQVISATFNGGVTWSLGNLEAGESGAIVVSGIIPPDSKVDLVATTATIHTLHDGSVANNQARDSAAVLPALKKTRLATIQLAVSRMLRPLKNKWLVFGGGMTVLLATAIVAIWAIYGQSTRFGPAASTQLATSKGGTLSRRSKIAASCIDAMRKAREIVASQPAQDAPQEEHVCSKHEKSFASIEESEYLQVNINSATTLIRKRNL